MFQGEHTNNMDDKGRVSIPAPFRETLRSSYDDERIVLARDYDGCLRAYPVQEWERNVLRKVRNLPMNDPKVRAFERFVISAAIECRPDRQGRILVTSALRNYAELDKSVVFAGGTTHFEIWDATRREARLEEDLNLLQNGGLDF